MRSPSWTSVRSLVILGPALAAAAAAPADEAGPPPALEKGNGLPGRIFVQVEPKPGGTLRGTVAVNPGALSWSVVLAEKGHARVSPDGRSLAFLHRDRDTGFEVRVARIGGGDADEPVTVFHGLAAPVGWSPDGKEVFVGEVPEGKVATDQIKFQVWRASADGSTRTQLPLPGTHQVFDVSRDGNRLLAQVHRPRRNHEPPNPARVNRPIVAIRPDGKDERYLASGEDAPAAESDGPDHAVVFSPRFSPDGLWVAYVLRDYRGRGEASLMVVSVDGKNRRRLLSVSPWQKAYFSPCWSPDGKWLAVAWNETGTAGAAAAEGRIDIMAADGSSRRSIHLPAVASVQVFDWR